MRLRIYLDTSVVSACVDDRLPERKRESVQFWDRLVDYEVTVSDLTVAEIQATQDPTVRDEMMRLIHPFSVLPVDEEARRVAKEYVRRGVFSAGSMEDAVHVAVAVVSRQDMIVSWNFRHLVNRRRRALINQANIFMGYPTIEILAPPEV